jgi:hypothetical protein
MKNQFIVTRFPDGMNLAGRRFGVWNRLEKRWEREYRTRAYCRDIAKYLNQRVKRESIKLVSHNEFILPGRSIARNFTVIQGAA